MLAIITALVLGNTSYFTLRVKCSVLALYELFEP